MMRLSDDVGMLLSLVHVQFLFQYYWRWDTKGQFFFGWYKCNVSSEKHKCISVKETKVENMVDLDRNMDALQCVHA